LGDDVWFAHGVHINPEEIKNMAKTHTVVAHCPSSNMRLASGIAPVRGYLDAGVRTASAWMALPATTPPFAGRGGMALLLQRVSGNPAGHTAEEALWYRYPRGARSWPRRHRATGRVEGRDFNRAAAGHGGYAGVRSILWRPTSSRAPQQVDLSVIMANHRQEGNC
jgi:hypothetical protein